MHASYMQRALVVGSLGVACAFAACGDHGAPSAPADAAVDVSAPLVDAPVVVVDAGERPPFEAGGFCAPRSFGELKPRWAPPVPRRAVCTEQEIYSIQNCFIAPQLSGTACAEVFDGGVNADCVRCAASRATDDTTGVLIVDGAYARLNVGGCFYVATGDVHCAQAIEFEAQCVDLACEGCRAGGSDTFESCAAEARRSEPTCVKADFERTACLSILGPVPAVCTPGPDFYRSAHEVARFWCGPGASDDGGADATTD